jgi:hypothetical protein
MKNLANKLVCTGIGCLLLSVAFQPAAQGQFGIDLAAIIAGLQSVNSALGKYIGAPLTAIDSTASQSSQFMQGTIYPTSDIQSNQALAGSMASAMSRTQSTLGTPYSSTTLPATSSLESAELSNDPNSVNSVGSSFSQVYGALPTANSAASQDTVNAIDMGDAQAQDAMKKSIILDSIASREMEVAQNLMSQLKGASPGTAGMIEAQASAWVLQGNAYTQNGMASLLRVTSANLSYSGYQLKHGSASAQNLQQMIQNLYSR